MTSSHVITPTLIYTHIYNQELYNELPSQATPCEGESIPMMQQRWHRLTTTFWLSKKNHFDTTKIPDIFDYINYDILHNHKWLNHIDLSALYEKAVSLVFYMVDARRRIYNDDVIVALCATKSHVITDRYEVSYTPTDIYTTITANRRFAPQTTRHHLPPHPHPHVTHVAMTRHTY